MSVFEGMDRDAFLRRFAAEETKFETSGEEYSQELLSKMASNPGWWQALLNVKKAKGLESLEEALSTLKSSPCIRRNNAEARNFRGMLQRRKGNIFDFWGVDFFDFGGRKISLTYVPI